MTRLEAAALVERLEGEPDVRGAVCGYTDALWVVLCGRASRHVLDAARERLITALCGEEPTHPLAGNERSE